jgi:hypothetical protein
MTFFKLSKTYTTEFNYKVRVINIDRIFSTTDEDNIVIFIDGDSVIIDNNDYQELEEYLLYESDSETDSEEAPESVISEEDSETDSEEAPESVISEEDSEEPLEKIIKPRGFLSFLY